MNSRREGPQALLPSRRPVPRGAAEELQKLIQGQKLRPGDQLPAQRELAEQLGVSRASLREALTALETLGLISVQPGRGVFVAAPQQQMTWRFGDRGSPHNVYEARLCVEVFAAGMAAERIDETTAGRLRTSVQDLRRAYEARDVDGMAVADSMFHDIIIEVCGNPILTAMYRSVREMMVESQKLPMLSYVRLESTVLEHEDLLACLVAHDGAGASARMDHHIRSAAARFGLDLNKPPA
ncbi:MAG TPA: FadR/GntR family transcriptional regulator [Microvirga sp.]|jgi:GntR family transcriptional repressor for pyruvate dehydrogenase complex